mmetsp:Transcript_5651/g.10130  ORF Transcript_5651/g.10130 Transcript_5651/m.10130 type:complete len:134 (-) Transcript_5651:109-510(-)
MHMEIDPSPPHQQRQDTAGLLMCGLVITIVIVIVVVVIIVGVAATQQVGQDLGSLVLLEDNMDGSSLDQTHHVVHREDSIDATQQRMDVRDKEGCHGFEYIIQVRSRITVLQMDLEKREEDPSLLVSISARNF